MRLINIAGSFIWITGNNSFKYFDTTHTLSFNKEREVGPKNSLAVRLYFKTKSEAEEVYNYLDKEIINSKILTATMDKNEEKIYEKELWFINVRGKYSFVVCSTPEVLRNIYIELRKLGYKTIWRRNVSQFIIV